MLAYNAAPENNMFAYLMDIGIDSLYIGGTLFLASAITNLSNGYGHTQATNALEYDLEDFEVSKRFIMAGYFILAFSIATYIIYW